MEKNRHKDFLVTLAVITIVFLSILLLSFNTTRAYLNDSSVAVKEENGLSEDMFEEKTPEEIAREEEEAKKQEEIRLIEERRLKEEARKEKLGDFYVPLPPLEPKENPPVKAKGIFVTGNTVGSPSRFSPLLDLVDSTELNAMVIDVKNDNGLMTYKSEIEIVQNVGANRSLPIKSVEALMAELNKRDIYPIARIVVFKDPHLAEQRPEWAIQSNEGGIWRDNKGVAWINPYNKYVWDYNIAIAQEAALVGFREIQFDYVRFPENAARVDREAYYPGEDGLGKDEGIENFLIYAGEKLEDYNVYIAADTFGVIATSWGDSDRIGQSWERIAPVVDYNCPMIYPSHYGEGYFGFAVPDANPAGTVERALTDAIKRNAPIENPAIIRPWLQSFTATWIKGYIPYGAKEVRAQIDAALKLGINEYLIWNSANRYTAGAFLTAKEAVAKEREYVESRKANKQDVLRRTPDEALKIFMTSMQQNNWREAFVLHSIDFSVGHEQYEQWFKGREGKLIYYKVIDNHLVQDKEIYEIDFTIRHNDRDFVYEAALFEVYEENSIWRIKTPEIFMEAFAMDFDVNEGETEEQSEAEE